jgi:hypothetical protein
VLLAGSRSKHLGLSQLPPVERTSPKKRLVVSMSGNVTPCGSHSGSSRFLSTSIMSPRSRLRAAEVEPGKLMQNC